MNPLSTSRNRYYDNEKNSSIMTPEVVSKFICSIIKDVVEEKTPYFMPSILDPCCGTGNLLKPYIELGWVTAGVDIQDETMENNVDIFRKDNFLSMKLKDFESEEIKGAPYFDIVICNPPFNRDNEETKRWMKEHKVGKALLPELFADKVFELFGKEVPLILFTPMGLRLNQRIKSTRWKKMRDNYPQITSIISLPLDIFPDVEFHNEIVIFNMPELQPHYFLEGVENGYSKD